jgi:hypothetical protein
VNAVARVPDFNCGVGRRRSRQRRQSIAAWHRSKSWRRCCAMYDLPDHPFPLPPLCCSHDTTRHDTRTTHAHNTTHRACNSRRRSTIKLRASKSSFNACRPSTTREGTTRPSWHSLMTESANEMQFAFLVWEKCVSVWCCRHQWSLSSR